MRDIELDIRKAHEKKENGHEPKAEVKSVGINGNNDTNNDNDDSRSGGRGSSSDRRGEQRRGSASTVDRVVLVVLVFVVVGGGGEQEEMEVRSVHLRELAVVDAMRDLFVR